MKKKKSVPEINATLEVVESSGPPGFPRPEVGGKVTLVLKKSALLPPVTLKELVELQAFTPVGKKPVTSTAANRSEKFNPREFTIRIYGRAVDAQDQRSFESDIVVRATTEEEAAEKALVEYRKHYPRMIARHAEVRSFRHAPGKGELMWIGERKEIPVFPALTRPIDENEPKDRVITLRTTAGRKNAYVKAAQKAGMNLTDWMFRNCDLAMEWVK